MVLNASNSNNLEQLALKGLSGWLHNPVQRTVTLFVCSTPLRLCQRVAQNIPPDYATVIFSLSSEPEPRNAAVRFIVIWLYIIILFRVLSAFIVFVIHCLENTSIPAILSCSLSVAFPRHGGPSSYLPRPP